jgi:hypothetical protein
MEQMSAAIVQTGVRHSLPRKRTRAGRIRLALEAPLMRLGLAVVPRLPDGRFSFWPA